MIKSGKTKVQIPAGTDFDDYNRVTDDNQQNKEAVAFEVKSQNDWLKEASTKPLQKMLFGSLIIEGETTFLYGQTNTGKSILANQIGNYIASKNRFDFSHYGIVCEVDPVPVLMIDFEMNDRQLFRRYSNISESGSIEGIYQFSEQFYRAEPRSPEPTKIINQIEELIIRYSPRLLIIDNITWIATQLEKSDHAAAFMQKLHKIKNRYGVTLLIIAHTPKRDQTQVLTINDLAGSAKIGYFIDSAFAIGHSAKDKSCRYIKQTKTRYDEIVFDTENVLECTVEKNSSNLQFVFNDCGNEFAHLTSLTDEQKKDRDAAIIAAHETGKSYRDIGKQFGISHMTVKRIVKKNEGIIPPF